MILIRADANEQIGMGHIMRCLSIAHAFACRNAEVVFATADHKNDQLIKSRGFESLCLSCDYKDHDNEKLVNIVDTLRCDLVLLDSYYVTERVFDRLSSVSKTAYLDDLNLARWNVDYLVNYNVSAEALDYSWYQETRTILLLHPQYAPLRDEFIDLPVHKIKTVKDILFSAGGADPEHVSEQFIQEIIPDYPGIRFHFVIGAHNPRLETIRALSAVQPNIVLHINEQHMADLMVNCDLAVSAAGSTLYELCACGTPAITYTLADNQLAAAEQFDKQGIMLNAGDCRGDKLFVIRLQKLLDKMLENNCLRSKISVKMHQLVDGYGAYRIADAMLKK